MIIIAQNKHLVLDTGKYQALTIGKDVGTVYAIIDNERPRFLGAYENTELSEKVLEDLAKAWANKVGLYRMPSLEEAQEKFGKPSTVDQPWHHATGKKLKRHGGS